MPNEKVNSSRQSNARRSKERSATLTSKERNRSIKETRYLTTLSKIQVELFPIKISFNFLYFSGKQLAEEEEEEEEQIGTEYVEEEKLSRAERAKKELLLIELLLVYFIQFTYCFII